MAAMLAKSPVEMPQIGPRGSNGVSSKIASERFKTGFADQQPSNAIVQNCRDSTHQHKAGYL